MAMRCLIRVAVCIMAVPAIAPSPSAAQSIDNPSALNRQVVELYQAGKYAEAIPIAERALTVADDRFGADSIQVGIELNNLAALYDKQGRSVEALPLLRRAQAIRETALTKDQASRPTVPAEGKESPAEGDQFLSEGAAAFEKGDTDRAIAAYDKAIENAPNDVSAYIDRGLAYQSKGDYERAITDFDKAIVVDPNNADAYNSRAWAYFQRGKPSQGLPDAERAAELAPNTGYIRDTRGQIYAALGRREEAISELQQALFLAPDLHDSVEALKRLGVTAIARPSLPVELPNALVALNAQVRELYEQGKYAEAEPLLKRLLSIAEKALGPEHPTVATALDNLAEPYRAQGRYTEAEPLYKRSLSIREKALGPDHLDVATSLNNLAMLYQFQGRYAEAEPLYKRSLSIREKALGPDHPDVATSLNNLALLYQFQGRYGEAEPLLKRALSILEKAQGPDHPAVATALNNLATLYQFQGRYGEAEPLLKRALNILEKAQGPDHPHVATALNNLATLYQFQGRHGEAEPLLKRALSILEKAQGPDHPDVATALNNLALLYQAQGRYDEAEPLLKRALSILEKAQGPDHPDVATALNNLALLYQAQGRYDEAEPLHKRSLSIAEEALGPGHPNVAKALNTLAELYLNHGRYADAEPLLKRALSILEKAQGPDHPNVAGALNNLAWLYRAQGRYGEAEPLYKRSLSIREKALGPDHPDVASALNNLALLYWHQGRYAEAEPLYQRSLSIREEALGPDHPDVATTLNNLAALHFGQDDWVHAAEFWRQSTVIIAGRAERAAQTLGKRLTGKRDSEAAQLSWQFWSLVKAGYRLVGPESAPAPGLMAEMFETAQWAKSSEAAASLVQMAARGASGDANLAAIVRERDDLVAEWQAKDQRLDAAFSQPPEKRNRATEETLRKQMSAIDARLAEIDARLKKDFPEYAALVSPEPVTIAELQGGGPSNSPPLLRDDEALLLFLDTPPMPPTPEESFVWVVTKSAAKWFRSGLGTKVLSERVQALRCGLDDGNWVRGEDGAWENPERANRCIAFLGAEKIGNRLPFNNKALSIAHELYQELLAPAEDLIAGKELLIVPLGPLTALPFQVLVSEAPDLSIEKMPDAHRKAAWLARSHALTVLPAVASLKALRLPKRTAPAPEPFLGFGDPILTGGQACEETRTAEVCPTAPGTAPIMVAENRRGITPSVPRSLWQGLARPEAINALGRLCDTAFELRCVAHSLRASETSLFLGEGATERAVKELSKDGSLSRYRVVHFATHGLLAGELGGTDGEAEGGRLQEAGLVFTPPKTPTEEDDGLLTASEITELKLNAEWVILSACNTAAGDRPGTEALSGLARAFFYAGTRSLLVSHWPVVSSAAVELTTRTLERLRTDHTLSKAEALRRSMAELYSSERPSGIITALAGDKAHPAYWAPFVIVGEGR